MQKLYDALNIELNDDEIIKLVEDLIPTFKPVGRKGQTVATDAYFRQLKDASYWVIIIKKYQLLFQYIIEKNSLISVLIV